MPERRCFVKASLIRRPSLSRMIVSMGNLSNRLLQLMYA